MKPICVMKFGGSSLADRECMERAAQFIAARHRDYAVVCVVSAMGKETDRLAQLGGKQRGAEADVLFASGEQISAALLALVLQKNSTKARSFMGWQVPILTNSNYNKASIERIEETHLLACLAEGQVAVVAGFQGVDESGRITTLGRGGSDTSAVALAVALKAECCQIYTDVEGVFTADPQIVDRAHCLPSLTYEEMVELSSLGARVLQTRSVALAARHQMKVEVLPSYKQGQGTSISAENGSRNKKMEQQQVSGIAHSEAEAKITLSELSDKPGIAARIFAPLSQAGILIDMIVQTSSLHSGSTDITFTLAEGDLAQALEVLKQEQQNIGYKEIAGDKNVAKVSVVGVGMRSVAGIADVMFATLAQEGINIQAISTSEIKISVLVEVAQMAQAVRALHAAYGLDR